MKKTVCLAGVLLLLAFWGFAGEAAEGVRLVYAEVNPASTVMGRTAQAFKEKVEELSKGSVVIDVHFSGALGAENDVLDTMIGGGGTVDLSRISTFSLNTYGAKRLSLLGLPYTFSGREHFWKFAGSPLGEKLLNESSELGLGIKGLFYVEEGFRHFFFNSKIEGLADLAGKKIRVPGDPILLSMVKEFHAFPTVIPFTELYSALMSKAIDGAEQPLSDYRSNVFYEIVPHVILDGHTLGCGEVIITDSAWNKLTDAQKGVIAEAGKYAGEFNAQLSEQVENECIDSLKALGVTFTEVKDPEAWREACKGVIFQFSKGMEKEYRAILDMAK